MRKLLGFCALVLVIALGGVKLQTAQAQGNYHIVFVSNRDGNEEIYVMDANGQNPRNLTRNRARDWHPDWSPDGQQIVFTSDRDGNQELYVMNSNGSSPTNLTQSQSNENSPAWSRDGKSIAFASDRDGAPDLYRIDVASHAVTRLTSDGTVKGAPAWSPDGQQIVYWADDGGMTQIFVLDVSTLERRQITEQGPNNWPAWSPDGNHIAYENVASTTADILTLDLSSGVISDVTNNPANDLRPAWSADGSQIVFTSDRDGNLELYLMNADGLNVRRLTATNGDESSPAWQPVPAAIAVSEGSATVDLSFTVLPANAVGNTTQQEFGDGHVRLYAPKQTNVDTVFQVRLEVTLDQAVLPTPTPSLGGTLPTPTPLTEQGDQFTSVYRVMGAELQGIDMSRFRVSPTPTDYVLRLDPNAVNFWEWTLRPDGSQSLGQNFLSVNLYIPEVQTDGTFIKTVLNTIPFQVEVLTPNASVDNADVRIYNPLPQPTNPDFSILFSDDNSFTVLLDGSADITNVTVAPAGGMDAPPIGTLFPVVKDTGWQWLPGVCIRLIRESTSPVLPFSCTGQLVERSIAASDVFWYDPRSNRLLDIIVRYNGRAIPCSSAEARCDIGG